MMLNGGGRVIKMNWVHCRMSPLNSITLLEATSVTADQCFERVVRLCEVIPTISLFVS